MNEDACLHDAQDLLATAGSWKRILQDARICEEAAVRQEGSTVLRQMCSVIGIAEQPGVAWGFL